MCRLALGFSILSSVLADSKKWLLSLTSFSFLIRQCALIHFSDKDQLLAIQTGYWGLKDYRKVKL